MCDGEEGDASILGRLEHASLHVYAHCTSALIQKGKSGSGVEEGREGGREGGEWVGRLGGGT